MDLKANLKASKLPRIDGLRAVSALLVILYHYGYTFIPAGFGVMVFFVISGFLITWLLLKEREKSGTVSLKNFYIRRALRIFPAFYCFWICVTVLLIVLHRSIIWPQAISSFCYVANYYQGLHGYPSTAYALTWSLSVEEQFYLLWPLTFLLLSKSPKKLAITVCAMIGAVWIYRLTLHFTHLAPEEYIYTSFDTRIDHLLIGCALAIALRFGFLSRVWLQLGRRSAWMGATLLLILGSMSLGYRYGIAYRNTAGFIVDPMLVAVLLVQLLSFTSRWTTWLDWPPIAYLGTISYATYLYHEVAMGAVGALVHRFQLPQWVTLAGGLAVVYAVASISYVIIERPCLRMKDRFQGTPEAIPEFRVAASTS